MKLSPDCFANQELNSRCKGDIIALLYYPGYGDMQCDMAADKPLYTLFHTIEHTSSCRSYGGMKIQGISGRVINQKGKSRNTRNRFLHPS